MKKGGRKNDKTRKRRRKNEVVLSSTFWVRKKLNYRMSSLIDSFNSIQNIKQQKCNRKVK